MSERKESLASTHCITANFIAAFRAVYAIAGNPSNTEDNNNDEGMRKAMKTELEDRVEWSEVHGAVELFSSEIHRNGSGMREHVRTIEGKIIAWSWSWSWSWR